MRNIGVYVRPSVDNFSFSLFFATFADIISYYNLQVKNYENKHHQRQSP